MDHAYEQKHEVLIIQINGKWNMDHADEQKMDHADEWKHGTCIMQSVDEWKHGTWIMQMNGNLEHGSCR